MYDNSLNLYFTKNIIKKEVEQIEKLILFYKGWIIRYYLDWQRVIDLKMWYTTEKRGGGQKYVLQGAGEKIS